MRHEVVPSTKAPAWPYASLLFLGFFGAADAAGKRAAVRGGIALVFLAAGLVLAQADGAALVSAVGRVILVGAVGFLAWSTALYLRALDELSRLIQLEAFAWSYGGLVLLAFAAIALGGGPADVSVSPLWIIAGEVLRGLALVLVARRYR